MEPAAADDEDVHAYGGLDEHVRGRPKNLCVTGQPAHPVEVDALAAQGGDDPQRRIEPARETLRNDERLLRLRRPVDADDERAGKRRPVGRRSRHQHRTGRVV